MGHGHPHRWHQGRVNTERHSVNAVTRAFLEAIAGQGRAYYAISELVIDPLYPPLYAVSRGLALWWLTMPGHLREDPLPLKVRYAFGAVPILMASFDLIENGSIAVMLWTWPDVSHGVVEASSLATRAKEDHGWRVY